MCVCVCVRKREREREGPIESVDSVINLSPLIKRERWCCEEKYVSDFLVACLWEKSRAERRATPRKKEKRRQREWRPHNTQHAENNNKKKKKKCFAER